MSTSILCSVDTRGVATLSLNRPTQHNAFDDVLIQALTAHLHDLNQDTSVRVVILAATGESFSAGANLHWMRKMADYTSEQNVEDAMRLGELLFTLHTLSKPTIARVQGAAFGGGVGLVAACDMAVGLRHAQFCLSEVRLGLIPAIISPYVITAIGARAARRYFLTAERFNAADALQLGLLHHVAEDLPTLDEHINHWLTQLLNNSPTALGEAKNLIHAVAHQPLTPELVQETARRIARVRASEQGKEGIAAFLQKRAAAWVQG